MTQTKSTMSIVLLRVLAWVSLTVIIVLTVVPPAMRPVTAAPSGVEHSAIFLLAGALFVFAYEIRMSVLIAAAVIFAGCLELLQLYIPGRHARLSDALIDASSACAGIAIAQSLLWLQHLTKNSKKIHAPD